MLLESIPHEAPPIHGTRRVTARFCRMKRVRSAWLQRRLWLVAAVAVVVALVAGTWWLLIKDTRGSEIATVLALAVAILGLLAAVVNLVVAWPVAGESNGLPRYSQSPWKADDTPVRQRPGLTQPPRGARPQPYLSARSWWRVTAAVLLIGVLAFIVQSYGPGMRSFLDKEISRITASGPGGLRPTPPAPTQIIAKASGKGPWTVRGYGYEFSVTRIMHTIGPFGPNEGKPCLRVISTVERFAAEDHAAMKLIVTDDKQRILASDPFSNKGTLEPPLHRKTQVETVVVLEGTGASTLTFLIRGHFWPDGMDLILEGVPIPR